VLRKGWDGEGEKGKTLLNATNTCSPVTARGYVKGATPYKHHVRWRARAYILAECEAVFYECM